MDLIHFILDLAALLLWLNWRGKSYDALADASPATLAGTLRRADRTPTRRWYFPVALLALLPLRAVLYSTLGAALNWTPQLNVIATSLAFKSDFYRLMLIFSVLSFAVTLLVFYLWLLLISMLARGQSESQFPVRLARAHLGFVANWPAWLKLVLPFTVAFAGWWLLTWPLTSWGLMPRPGTESTRLAQAALVGLGSYLTWKYLVVTLLALNLLHNHVYFGNSLLWKLVDNAARRILAPLRFLPLVVARVDFAPVLGIGLVLLLAYGAEHGLRPPAKLDTSGRPMRPAFEIPGLADYYRRVSR